MQRIDNVHDVVMLTRALISFVIIGAATVAIAVLAHLLPLGG